MKNTNKDLENNFYEAEKLRDSRNFNKAIKLFLDILEKKPNFLPALNNIANCYVQLNNLDLAEEYYLKCYKLDSSNLVLLNNLSILYLKLSKFKKSLKILKESLNKNSNQEPVVEKIAYCLTELSLFDEVDKFCEKFIKIYPKNKIILSYYRRNLFKIGKYIDGLKAYEKETGVIELDNDKIKII